MRSPCVELTRQTYVFPASLYNLGAAGLWCGYATKDSKLEHIVDTPERKINSLCRGQARDGRASLFTVSAPENRCSTHVQLNLRVIRRAELAIWNRARRKGTFTSLHKRDSIQVSKLSRDNYQHTLSKELYNIS